MRMAAAGSRWKMVAAFAAGVIITGLAVKWPEASRGGIAGKATVSSEAAAVTDPAKAAKPAAQQAVGKPPAPQAGETKPAVPRVAPPLRDVAALPQATSAAADAAADANANQPAGAKPPAPLAADQPLSELDAERAAKAVAERENAAAARLRQGGAQLSDAGMPVSQGAAQTSGVATPDADAKLANGKISAAQVADANNAADANEPANDVKRPAKHARRTKRPNHRSTRVARQQAPEQVEGFTSMVRVLPDGRRMTIYRRNDDGSRGRVLAYENDRAPRRGFFPFFGAND